MSCRYDRAASEIFHNRPPTEKMAARKILAWLICARQPLNWHEIQGAISISLEDNSVDFQGRQLWVHAKDICGSFVEVLPGGRLQLVHQSART
jgi:hypothetical protein